MWASVTGSTIGRAMSNLDAAEANLLRVAPDSYVAGQMPSLLNHVQRHLDPGDPRRRELERLAGRLGSDQALAGAGELSAITERERNAVVGSVRAASKAALRGIRGSSEPYGLPVALATLKLSMGAVTAFLGLLLMRGQFVPLAPGEGSPAAGTRPPVVHSPRPSTGPGPGAAGPGPGVAGPGPG
jgi:hypothetical protein